MYFDEERSEENAQFNITEALSSAWDEVAWPARFRDRRQTHSIETSVRSLTSFVGRSENVLANRQSRRDRLAALWQEA